MKNDKPIALWAVPRSISTAFERYFVERDDFEVLHEPFGDAYYYGTNRLSDRYAGEAKPNPDFSYENVLNDVLKPRERRVFVKDMAYQAKGVMGREFVSRFVNTIIVRDPKYVLASLYKMWPEFTFEEAGYEQLYRLYRLATAAGEDVVVVDAMTFSENPKGVLSTYCERVGVPFRPETLSWRPREVGEWERWEGWHDAAQESTGIEPASRRDPELPKELWEVYERCLPAYYKLAAEAIPGTVKPSV